MRESRQGFPPGCLECPRHAIIWSKEDFHTMSPQGPPNPGQMGGGPSPAMASPAIARYRRPGALGAPSGGPVAMPSQGGPVPAGPVPIAGAPGGGMAPGAGGPPMARPPQPGMAGPMPGAPGGMPPGPGGPGGVGGGRMPAPWMNGQPPGGPGASAPGAGSAPGGMPMRPVQPMGGPQGFQNQNRPPTS